MPFLLPYVAERPDDAIAQARADAIERAKDIWGLEYAEFSDGLYPSGNQIGRTQFRPSITRAQPGSTQPYIETAGGAWLTVYDSSGTQQGLVPDPLTGWADWFDFVLDEDTFIILEGVFSTDASPTIREIKFFLSGVELPIMQIEEIYANEEETNKGYFEVPAVVSPKSQMKIKARTSNITATDLQEGFGFLGELIAKRSFLIRETY